MKTARCTVTPQEALLIHAPILLFGLPLPALFAVAAHNPGPARAVCLFLAWWCASGTVMMCLDMRERTSRYARLVRAAAGGHTPQRPRQATICGWFLQQALRYRKRAASRFRAKEGVEA